VRIDARRTFVGLLIAGVAGGFLFLPAIVYVGSFLASPIAPSKTPVAPLLGDALWAKANGGRATTLEPINPFTLGRMAACHILAETTNDERAAQDAQHDECMKLMPGVQAVGYVSSIHLRSQGVWQDPRVPFVQIATMTRMSDKWTRTDLIDTLAERAEFPDGSLGVEQSARSYFGRSAAELNVAQAALLAAMVAERRVDPWCDPPAAARLRQRILDRMHDNLAIDDAAFASASQAALGITATPPENHKPCKSE